MCLPEGKRLTKNELLKNYISLYSTIEEEAFTQRLKNIYKKFRLVGDGQKLPQLQNYLNEKYVEYRNKDVFFSEIGLNYIHSAFPEDLFGKEIYNTVSLDNPEDRKIDILQTFAPNLDDYFDHLVHCLQNYVSVRILLAWPYSEAAKLRREVLRKYSGSTIRDETDVCDCVIANLETLEKIIEFLDNPKLLDIRLYDTLPSLAIYRAGDYMLASPFLHQSLAVNTFQLELKISATNPLVVKTLQDDFELMWKVARQFSPTPGRNWRNDLKILFMS
jgi:hypothetical protein